MNRYDNYNPEIYNIEEKSEESLEEAVNEKRPQKKSPRKTSSPRNRKPEEKKRNISTGKNSSGLIENVRQWANMSNVKLLTGIFLACLAVYFTISFISYFSSCIEDSSVIYNTAHGISSGIKNSGGEGGARLSNFLINDTFGLGSFVIILWLYAMSFKLLIGKPRFKSVNFTIKCLVALITVSLIVGLATIGMNTMVNWGGYHGRYVNEFIINYLGWAGASVLCIFMIAVFIVICLRDIVNWIMRLYHKRKEKVREQQRIRAEERKRREMIREMELNERLEAEKSGDNDPADKETDESEVTTISLETDTYVIEDELEEEDEESTSDKDETGDKSFVVQSESEEKEEGEDPLKMVVNVNSIEQSDSIDRGEKKNYPWEKPYKFPPADILRDSKSNISIDKSEQVENKELIRKTLLDFGIPIISIEATVGPTVTLYEIVPDTGVKIAKIRNLVDDIARSLSARGVRIIAPIPGKGTVGIEVANKDPQIVSMKSVILSRKYQENKLRLPIALGTTINNDVYITDLTKMPHLLVAGATGQGKSVGLNAIIASLLYKKKPDELKFVMVDPKMVEFILYSKIEKHYLAKLPDAEDSIITDMKYAVNTLNSLCVEMDNRYQLLKLAHARNLDEYNGKIKDKKLNPKDGHIFLPYIVVVVDEFSDLIMTAGKEVEMPIARLAQKARAVGIHVILATQRPSTNVITGIIKANFPARIAFKVYSGVDSKTIIDSTGAKQLIGNGDMLISNNSELVRVQCAFIDTPEVEAICDYVERQPYPSGAYILPEPIVSGEGSGDPDSISNFGSKDPLFEEVARLVINSATASTSSVQRHFAIGYNRAAKIMDQMEAVGIVGPSTGGKPRSVLVDPVTLEQILNSL